MNYWADSPREPSVIYRVEGLWIWRFQGLHYVFRVASSFASARIRTSFTDIDNVAQIASSSSRLIARIPRNCFDSWDWEIPVDS